MAALSINVMKPGQICEEIKSLFLYFCEYVHTKITLKLKNIYCHFPLKLNIHRSQQFLLVKYTFL